MVSTVLGRVGRRSGRHRLVPLPLPREDVRHTPGETLGQQEPDAVGKRSPVLDRLETVGRVGSTSGVVLLPPVDNGLSLSVRLSRVQTCGHPERRAP